jgi:hypothetical protein
VLYLVDVAEPALAQFLEDSVVAERLTDLKNGGLLGATGGSFPA